MPRMEYDVRYVTLGRNDPESRSASKIPNEMAGAGWRITHIVADFALDTDMPNVNDAPVGRTTGVTRGAWIFFEREAVHPADEGSLAQGGSVPAKTVI